MCIIQLLTSYKFLQTTEQRSTGSSLRIIVQQIELRLDERLFNWLRERVNEDALWWEPDTIIGSLREQSGWSESAARQKKKDLNKRLINSINQLIQESQPDQKVSQRSDLWATRDHRLINWRRLEKLINWLSDNQSVSRSISKRLSIELNDQLIGQPDWTKVNIEQWWEEVRSQSSSSSLRCLRTSTASKISETTTWWSFNSAKHARAL